MLRQTLHRPNETLERLHTWRNDLLGSQPLNGGLDERQGAVAFERQREQLTSERVQLWPAAVLEAELATQFVQVLEDGVVALAVLLEDVGVNTDLLRDVRTTRRGTSGTSASVRPGNLRSPRWTARPNRLARRRRRPMISRSRADSV
ncbi:MAG: hypothetical protein M3069_32705 [Chloroflexota bacterium]|nr:hypothetical protein [Chloroflexota bacterium]